MNAEHWQKVRRICEEALEREAAHRDDFLAEACAGDPALREEVKSFLAGMGGKDGFLEIPALDMAARDIAQDPERNFTGKVFLHYRLTQKIGAGGMGEVYRARDEHLQRDVAIKVLPDLFARDRERLARFDREARLLASLSHPNIAAVHGLEQDDGTRFIVLELVEGRTLAHRIDGGRLPIEESLEVSRQIAEGLAAAHEKGIVHRDLKPSNVMINEEGKVKILDFGLARALAVETAEVDTSHSPTHTASVTQPGLVLGTAAYMSPEQARGKAVDKRADVWAFGCILYECLTGRRPFQGETVTDTIVRILETEPDWALLPSTTPAAICALLKRCLKKDTGRRQHDMVDARIEIEEALAGTSIGGNGQKPVPVTSRSKSRMFLVSSAFVLTTLLLALALSRLIRPQSSDVSNYTYTPIAVEAAQEALGAWSPDGRSVAYLKEFSGSNAWEWHLMVRRLDSPTPARLTRMPGGVTYYCPPFWSPDGSRIFLVHRREVWSVSAAGGEPERVFPGKEGTGVMFAAFSPDGRTLALWRQVKEKDWSHSLWISSPPGSPPRRYEPGILSTPHVFLPIPFGFSPDGAKIGVFFANPDIGGTQFWVLPWPDRSSIEPYQPFTKHSWKIASRYFAWMSDSRHIVFSSNQRLLIGDIRAGSFSGLTTPAASETQPTVSPDGSRIILTRANMDYDIVRVPLDGSAPEPLLSTTCQEHSPSWPASRDQMAFATDRRGEQEVWLQGAGGEWERPVVTPQDFPGVSAGIIMPSISPDGSRIAYTRYGAGVTAGLWISHVEGGRPVRAFPGSEKVYSAPVWSPDGSLLTCYAWGDGGRARLLVLRPGTQEQPLLLPDLVYPQLVPAWSPSGEWIASGGEPNTIILVTPDGSRFEKFPSPIRIWVMENALFWSQDGGTLYLASSYNGGASLYALAISTGQWSKRADWGERIRFAGPAIFGNGLTARISRDGKSFITTAQIPHSDLWLLEGFPLFQAPKYPWLESIESFVFGEK